MPSRTTTLVRRVKAGFEYSREDAGEFGFTYLLRAYDAVDELAARIEHALEALADLEEAGSDPAALRVVRYALLGGRKEGEKAP